MNWIFFLCVFVLYQYAVVPVVSKKIGAVQGSRTRKLVWQYFFAALLALIVATVTGQLELSWSVAVVAVIGAANAFGCYCQWRAYDISLARTAMMSNLDDVLAIGLGYVFLGELKVLTPVLTAGIIISIISATVFARVKHSDDGSSGGLIKWVLGYTVIWGVAMFFERFFAVRGLSIPAFIMAWYVGAWFGALFTRFVIIGQAEAGPPLTYFQQAKVFLLAAVIVMSLVLNYWMRQLVPITVIQPIQLVAEMAVPTIIAMVFLGEARNMSRKEMVVIMGGLIGIVLIVAGFG